MEYVNRWSVTSVWVAAVVLAWFAPAPNPHSVSNLALALVGGPILLIGAATLWETSRPAPSFGQLRAVADARPVAAPRRRP
jgi:hypothetical protein